MTYLYVRRKLSYIIRIGITEVEVHVFIVFKWPWNCLSQFKAHTVKARNIDRIFFEAQNNLRRISKLRCEEAVYLISKYVISVTRSIKNVYQIIDKREKNVKTFKHQLHFNGWLIIYDCLILKDKCVMKFLVLLCVYIIAIEI